MGKIVLSSILLLIVSSHAAQAATLTIYNNSKDSKKEVIFASGHQEITLDGHTCRYNLLRQTLPTLLVELASGHGASASADGDFDVTTNDADASVTCEFKP